jgi:formamidopyrimidine-DNA glycosylase
MPELPEVQTVVDTLSPAILGRVVTKTLLRRGDVLEPAGMDLEANLIGRRILEVSRRGKKIVFRLDDRNRFYIHLGMTGRITLQPPTDEFLKHTHLTIELGNKQIDFSDPRRFGGIFWLGRDGSPDENMGPEPLTIRSKQLAEQLAKTSRAIKSALLDQSVIAGLGNIYVDESLFRSGIHPLTPADELSSQEISKLTQAIKVTLRAALRHRGSTLRDYFDANGDPGGFKKMHAVYDRKGEKCRRCRSVIERIVLGGRSTHFCPRCQRKT